MRFHELDALRAVAMLLGIVLHAALFLILGVRYTPVGTMLNGRRVR